MNLHVCIVISWLAMHIRITILATFGTASLKYIAIIISTYVHSYNANTEHNFEHIKIDHKVEKHICIKVA